MKPLSLEGLVYGRLTLVERKQADQQGYWWLAKCSCGKNKVVLAASVKAGKVKSCGCLRKYLGYTGFRHRPEDRKRVTFAQSLRFRYGLSVEDYARLEDGQERRCPGCLRSIALEAHVDHDHQSGEVRGLLCGRCNRGVGYLGDDSTTLLRLAEYLRPQTSAISSAFGRLA